MKKKQQQKKLKSQSKKTPKEQVEIMRGMFNETRATMSKQNKHMPPVILDYYTCSKHGLSIFTEDMRGQEDLINFQFKDCIDMARTAVRRCRCGRKMSYYGYFILGTMQAKKDKYPLLALIVHTKEQSIVTYQYYHENHVSFFGEVITESPEKRFNRFVIPLTEQPKHENLQENKPSITEETRKEMGQAVKMFLENMKAEIALAFKTSDEKHIETGFRIFGKMGKRGMKVWPDDYLTLGNENGVRLGAEDLKDLKIDATGKEVTADYFFKLVDARRKAQPDFLGDFHIHLSPLYPINIVDMFQTMVNGGIFTAVGQRLNKNTVRINYLFWDIGHSRFNDFLIEALAVIAKFYDGKYPETVGTDLKKAIIRSGVATHYSFEMAL